MCGNDINQSTTALPMRAGKGMCLMLNFPKVCYKISGTKNPPTRRVNAITKQLFNHSLAAAALATPANNKCAQ